MSYFELPGDWPRLFALERKVDVTGQSGQGHVASGVIWPDGRTTMRWICPTPPPGYPHTVHQVATYASSADMVAVHGHGGATVLAPRHTTLVHPNLGGMQLFALLGDFDRVKWWGVSWQEADAVMWSDRLRGPSTGTRIAHFPAGVDAVREDQAASGAGLRLVWLSQDAERVYRAG